MSLKEMLDFNKNFVENKHYTAYETNSLPNKKMVVLTCMESRLVELLPRALNIQNGDVKMLKNAGAVLRRPFDNMTKSILIAVHNLQAESVLIIGHYDCGMSKVNTDELIQHMIEKGISKETIDLLEKSGINFEEEFEGFQTVEDSIRQGVNILREHPLLPDYVRVHGLVMDPSTGQVHTVTTEDES